MKLLLLAILLISSPSAFAGDRTDILGDPAVVAITKILNEKHDGKCVAPLTRDDLHWACTGLRKPGPRPKLESFGCGVYFTIRCPGETVSIYGHTKSYQFNDSNGESTTTPETFSIHQVESSVPESN